MIEPGTQLDRRELARLAKDGWKLTPATSAYKLTNGQWIPAAHLKYVALKIAQKIQKGRARLIVTMPFRHGKSELLSVHTPVWFLNRWPSKYVMLLSYGADLATDKSRVARDLIGEHPDLLDVKIRKDSFRVERFLTTDGGGMFAAGLGGVITGRGAHLLLVDDYIKNTEEALSPTKLEKDFQWFISTARTRLEPGGSIVILATRWASRDLIGRLKEEQPDVWEEISLPLMANPSDPLGRAEGEPLWPERYDAEEVASIKTDLGNYWFQAQCQQAPLASMSDAARGSYLNILDIPPHYNLLRTVRSWDFASTEGGGDWTVGPLCAINKETGDFIILDIRRFQKGPFETEKRVTDAAEYDERKHPGNAVWIEQEPGSAGKIVLEHYCKKVLKNYPANGERATGPLPVRASPFLAALEAGRVYVTRAPWNQDLIDELNAFPMGPHDDQIAALALAFKQLVKVRRGVVWGNDTKRDGWGNKPTFSKTMNLNAQRVKGVVW